MNGRWMIYGANGYTGDLVARRAVARGERPTLAGRNAPAIRALAGELGLPHAVFDLSDTAAVRSAVSDFTLVAHLAGPYARTAAPMLDACLAEGTHYLDITGEPAVFTDVLGRDDAARAAGVVLLTGAGFDVVPTDCLAGLVAARLPGAVSLEIAFRAPGGMSRGTLASGIGFVGEGASRRVGGRLVRTPLGVPSKVVPFPSGERRVGALTWGDLITAHRSTGIGDITTYSTVARRSAVTDLARRLLLLAPVRVIATRVVRRGPVGPSPRTRADTMIEVWAEVRDASGETRAATLTGPNAYDLTADSVVRAAQRLLTGDIAPGAHTPATALGPDFAHTLDGVHIQDL